MSLFYFIANMKRPSAIRLFKCLQQQNNCVNLVNKTFFSQGVAEEKSRFIPFKDVINQRKLQASKSVLVQVQSEKSHKELYSYCNGIGKVKEMFHYSSGVEPLHFILVEFVEEADVGKVLSNSVYLEDTQIVPVQSVFLWFKAPGQKGSKHKYSSKSQLQIENATAIIPDNILREKLQEAKCISEQMTILHDSTKLNDVGIRLRYLAAKQIESALSGLFPKAKAYPFGSSVNGFGKMGCDLDLVLRLHETNKSDGRLVFHSKASTGNDRFTSQRHMDVVGDLLQLFLPGCAQVRKILQARVPIIKYCQQFTDVDCDLSMANMSGVYMSELLYIFGELDERVRPLIFTLRKWASEVGITNNYPGRWITNFSLTLMVLAFLQQQHISILPNINTLVKAARSEDAYMTEDGINCTFLRDINTLNFERINTDSLETLLQKFFEYYSQFDFSSRAICLNDSTMNHKPDHSPLYIVNPLERGLNVSKNVSPDELEKVKMELRNAVWWLQSSEYKSFNWGILSLFDSKRKSFTSNTKHTKMIEVSKLFEEEANPKEIEFKNEQVAKEVSTIKAEARTNIKQMADKLNRKLYR